MHFLLIAYDFPPVPSPQALRWAYLVRELALAGHRVEVIAPDVPGYGAGGLPKLPRDVVVHRVDPGRLSRMLQGRRRIRKAEIRTDSEEVIAPLSLFSAEAKLNWKGRLRQRFERALGCGGGLNWKGILAEKVKARISDRMFPDYRAEWVPHAVSKLDELVANDRPDVIVVSHEPACTLPVGLAAAKRGLPLAVDLGDPVLAPYTPEKWRKQAFDLEREVCQVATMVSVTTEAAVKTLQQRHGIADHKLKVVRQGFDPRFVVLPAEDLLSFDSDKLELLYTGSFYSFRRAEDLFHAVCSTAGVRLTVATLNAPDYLVEAATSSPDKIRLMGFMPHRAALAAQRACDVLVNLANADPVQVPGKIFEYLGAAKPILHLRGAQSDATGQMLSGIQGGWDIASERVAIEQVLSELLQLKATGELGRCIARRDQVQAYAWPELAGEWVEGLKNLMREKASGRTA